MARQVISRVYYPYYIWEDWKYGMWRDISDQKERDRYLKLAIKFTGNTKLYGFWMLKVIDQWPFACFHNLSNLSINRQAWIGHSACCLAIGCPEDITRLAWHHLTQQQQDNANLQADIAIAEWESMNFKGKQLCLSID
jgi:hypothetical protein